MWPQIAWSELGMIALKVSVVYWLMIIGLKMVGRRAFGQLGPHEFILIAILAKVMADQIVTKESGLLGNIVGGVTLFIYVALIERIPQLRQFVQGRPILLLHQGKPQLKALKKAHLSVADLDEAARHYGFANYHVFETVMLERNGRMTGVLKPLSLSAPLSLGAGVSGHSAHHHIPGSQIGQT